MSVMTEKDPDFSDFFSNLDTDEDWKNHDPVFEWTEDDLAEFEYEEKVAEQERLSMAAWWENEGVRCGTWLGIIPGYDPNKNPYL